MKRAKRGATRLRKLEAKRKKACDGKRGHKTKHEATQHLFNLKMNGRQGMKEYLCKLCKLWHVGHKPRKGKAGGGR